MFLFFTNKLIYTLFSFADKVKYIKKKNFFSFFHIKPTYNFFIYLSNFKIQKDSLTLDPISYIQSYNF